jgi:hypothetical protein
MRRDGAEMALVVYSLQAACSDCSRAPVACSCLCLSVLRYARKMGVCVDTWTCDVCQCPPMFQDFEVEQYAD